jgi:hypothetical protein
VVDELQVGRRSLGTRGVTHFHERLTKLRNAVEIPVRVACISMQFTGLATSYTGVGLRGGPIYS